MSEQQSYEPPRDPREETIDLIDVIGVLYRYKWMIVGITFAAAVGVVVFSIVSIVMPPETSPLPNYYEPEAIVLIDGGQQQAGGLQQALQAQGLGGFAGAAGVETGGYGELAPLIMRTNTVLDTIVDEFDVIERFDVDEPVRSYARRAVRENMSVQHESETRTLHLRFSHIDPEYATGIVNRLVELLEDRFSNLSSTREEQRRDMIEGKLVDLEEEIERMESEIQDFQRRYGAIDPQAYAREQVSMVGELRSRLIATEIEARMQTEFSHIDDPQTQRLRAEADELRSTIEEMEARYFRRAEEQTDDAENMLSDAGIPDEDIPELATRYARLERELNVQGRIYESLNEQYELARLAAEDESLAFQVVEYADVPELKAGPSRAVLSIIVTFTAFFGSIFLAFVRHVVCNVMADPDAMRRLRGE